MAGVALAIYAIFISGIYYREEVWAMFLSLSLDKELNFGLSVWRPPVSLDVLKSIFDMFHWLLG